MNVPKLRFKEFDGEWEEKEFGDLFEVKSGYAFKLKDYVSHGVSLINGESIQSDCIQTNNINFLPDNFLVQYKAFKLNTNDIVLGLNRPIIGGKLKIARVPEELNNSLLYQRAGKIIFKSKELCGSFFYTFLSKEIYKFAKKESVGSDQPFISTTKLNKWKFTYPINLLEQQKIGTLFEILNKKIQLQQQKIDLLQEQKKGYMQKLLPELNELIPKKRFEGFTDNWSICKIKEICKISTGKGNTQDKVEGGTYPFYVRSATIERSNDFLYDQEAVLTIGDGVGTGKVFHYVNGKYNLHQRVYRMYNFENTVLAKYFYYYFSENFYRRVMAMTAKTSVDSVRMDMIAEMDIKYPSLLEQKRIVEFFNKLDNNIKLQEKKLELLQQKKQGFMQQMFI